MAQPYRDHVREILADPEFGPLRPEIYEWLAPLFEWIGEMIERLLRAILPSGVGMPSASLTQIGQLVALVFVLGALLLIVYVVSSRLRDRRRREQVSFNELRLAPAHELLRLAEEAERKGDWERAYALFFWSALKVGDSAGYWRYADDRTNWEVLRTARQEPTRAHRLALRFDEIVFGCSAATAEDARRVREWVKDLQGEVRG